jgi:hypothetical protein
MYSLKSYIKSLYTDNDAQGVGSNYYNQIIWKSSSASVSSANLVEKLKTADSDSLCGTGSYAKAFFSMKWFDSRPEYMMYLSPANDGELRRNAHSPEKLAWVWSCCRNVYDENTSTSVEKCTQCGLERQPISCGVNKDNPCPGGKLRDDGDFNPNTWSCESIDDSNMPLQVINCGIDSTSACCGTKNNKTYKLITLGGNSMVEPTTDTDCAAGCIKTLVTATTTPGLSEWGCSPDLSIPNRLDKANQKLSKCRSFYK